VTSVVVVEGVVDEGDEEGEESSLYSPSSSYSPPEFTDSVAATAAETLDGEIDAAELLPPENLLEEEGDEL